MVRAMHERWKCAVVGCLALILFSLEGCSSEPPKPAPTVTPDQVRSHSDKAFDKLKQEEQNRATDAPGSR
jgi:hypothetical protein